MYRLLNPFIRFYNWLMFKQKMSIIKPQINELFNDELRREQFLRAMDKQIRINKYGTLNKKYGKVPSIKA